MMEVRKEPRTGAPRGQRVSDHRGGAIREMDGQIAREERYRVGG